MGVLFFVFPSREIYGCPILWRAILRFSQSRNLWVSYSSAWAAWDISKRITEVFSQQAKIFVAMHYIRISNLVGCITMNIRLIGKSDYGFKSAPSCCLQTRQWQREKVFKNNENARDFGIPDDGGNAKYRYVTLPKKTTAFFLSICCGDRIIPLESNDRIHVIDDKDGFPPGLAGCAIELRKKNIWVVQSRSRANRQALARYLATKQGVCDCCETSLRIKEHEELAKNCSPNTRNEMEDTFQVIAPGSPFCALMASHPERIQHYVREGCFYSGLLRFRIPEEGEVEHETVTCTFCQSQNYFSVREIEQLTDLQRNNLKGWRAVEAKLKGMIHDYGCCFREYLNDNALLEVSDQAGNIMPTQSYFIADPALESSGNVDDSGKSCTYTRLFVMADINEQERRRLIIPGDQINNIIHQQHLEALSTRTHKSTATLTTAIQDYEQVLQELPPRYQELYDNSELNRAVTSYRNKLQRLPSPRTQVQQEVLYFLADADAPLRALYAASKQLTHLLPLTRDANAGVLTTLTPKISELVAQYQQAIHAVYGRIDITNLTTLVPYELWSDCALREIGEVGNEVLDYLNRLTIDDNKLYHAFMAHQLSDMLPPASPGGPT